MIDALDSALPPDDNQVGQAKAAGLGGWWGYIATSGQGGSAFGLLRVWTLAEFDRVRALNSQPVAFCSGWDDPGALRALAQGWNVRLCLDDESGIRPPGGWEQAFLDVSGAGLYGNCPLHAGLTAAFHILSWYPGGPPPGSTWFDSQCPRPGGPVGWQWQGTHEEFGAEVDRGTYDDWFGELMMDEATFKQWVREVLNEGTGMGLANWAQTSQETLGVGQQNFNLGNEILAKVQTPPPVDVQALAEALAPLLPPETDPSVIADATVAAIKAQWAK
jgi:hypothetical protein